MLDKGHCKMIHEGAALAEYSDFYDYSSSYPDVDSEDVNLDDEVQLFIVPFLIYYMNLGEYLFNVIWILGYCA